MRVIDELESPHNDLGWLTEANAGLLSDSASQRFSYNALGQRRELIEGDTLSLTDYAYCDDTGSSKLLWFTGMGSDSRHYDMLGNLYDDSSRQLEALRYDYRNLLRYVYMPSTRVDSLHDVMRFEYNETGLRIKKTHHYWRLNLTEGTCPNVYDSVMEGSDPLGGGGMMMMIPPDDSIPQFPGDSNWCPHAYHAEKLYLYDGDALLATFNQNDEVEDDFVNGPTGRMASYFLNDDDRLYFYLNDNLGSPRAVVDSTGQTQFYVYHPFGAVRYSEGNHGTQYQFTGKERDEHGYFEFDYFGARYYDPRIGSFSSIDKAGQFASGYVYGANNPLVGVDPDGNFFGIVFALAPYAIGGAATSAVTYSAAAAYKRLETGKWCGSWDGLWKSMGQGAIGGMVGAGVSSVGNVASKIVGGKGGTSALRGVFGTAVGSGVSNMAIAAARGEKGNSIWNHGLSGFATGAVGGSGAFGLARKGMIGRLSYQALTSTMRSAGNNWASGSKKPFNNFTFGLGPINFRIGKKEKLLQWQDNWHTVAANALGATNFLLGKVWGMSDTKVEFDTKSLSFNWKGGPYANYFYPSTEYTLFDTEPADLGHEGTHLWMQRAMGPLFAGSWAYNTIGAVMSGRDFYYGNWHEQVAYTDPFYGGPNAETLWPPYY